MDSPGQCATHLHAVLEGPSLIQTCMSTTYWGPVSKHSAGRRTFLFLKVTLLTWAHIPL